MDGDSDFETGPAQIKKWTKAVLSEHEQQQVLATFLRNTIKAALPVSLPEVIKSEVSSFAIKDPFWTELEWQGLLEDQRLLEKAKRMLKMFITSGVHSISSSELCRKAGRWRRLRAISNRAAIDRMCLEFRDFDVFGVTRIVPKHRWQIIITRRSLLAVADQWTPTKKYEFLTLLRDWGITLRAFLLPWDTEEADAVRSLFE